MKIQVAAVIEIDEESGMYVGSVPQIPGAFTQGATIEELRINLEEVVQLLIEEMRSRGEEVQIGRLVGTETLSVSV